MNDHIEADDPQPDPIPARSHMSMRLALCFALGIMVIFALVNWAGGMQ